jgi:hypothetical protein
MGQLILAQAGAPSGAAAPPTNSAQTGQATTVVPGSPGSSPEHWTTRTFIFSGLAVVVIAIIAFLAWKRLMAALRESVTIRVVVYFSEAAAAIVLSIVASYFDVFKKATYVPTAAYQPDWHVIFWAAVWSVIAGYYCVVKLGAITTKESEEFKSKKLTSDLEKERAAKDALTSQRDLLAKITTFARQTVGKKTTRLSKLIAARPVNLQQFLGELNPRLQVQIMVKLVHEFFRKSNDEARLRLALCVQDAADPDRLSMAYAWDGESDQCFSGKSSEHMRIANPLGTRCEIVKSYHSTPGSIKIVPDCVKAAAEKQFEFLYAGQQDKVKSLVLYKHVFMADTQPVAVVLMLVSSLADHFRREDEGQIRQYLDEMLTRVEMEWIVLELTRDIGPAREAA